jgi:hypothetical protein
MNNPRNPIPLEGRKLGDNRLMEDSWFGLRVMNYLDSECVMGMECRTTKPGEDWASVPIGTAFCPDCVRVCPTATRNADLREVEAWLQANKDYAKAWRKRVAEYKQSDEYKARCARV